MFSGFNRCPLGALPFYSGGSTLMHTWNLHILTHVLLLCSGNLTAITLLAEQLKTNASVAVALAVQQLPEFGVNASSIRSIKVNSATLSPTTTVNGSASLINIDLSAVLVSRPLQGGGHVP